MLYKVRNKSIYWGIKSLIPYGFPKESIYNQIGDRKYGNYYHYIYNNDEEFEHDEEFEQALYKKHCAAKEMFSANNVLLLFIVLVNLFNILLLSSFILFCLMYISSFLDLFTTALFNTKLLAMGVILTFCAAFFFFAISYIFRYQIYRKYINILCIFEVICICQELENEYILSQSFELRSLRRRLLNLSKFFNKLSRFDRSEFQYYSRISNEISDNLNFLNIATDNTVEDLKKYFWDLKYCLILDKKKKKFCNH